MKYERGSNFFFFAIRAFKHMTLRDHEIDFDIENVRVRFVDYMMVVSNCC